MKVRFLADADLNGAILTGALRREPTIDFLTAQAAGLRGLSDTQVLALAADQGRMLLSHGVNTLPVHFRAFRGTGRTSPSVLLIPQSLAVGVAIEELLLVWFASDSSEWENRLGWLPLSV